MQHILRRWDSVGKIATWRCCLLEGRRRQNGDVVRMDACLLKANSTYRSRNEGICTLANRGHMAMLLVAAKYYHSQEIAGRSCFSGLEKLPVPEMIEEGAR